MHATSRFHTLINNVSFFSPIDVGSHTHCNKGKKEKALQFYTNLVLLEGIMSFEDDMWKSLQGE